MLYIKQLQIDGFRGFAKKSAPLEFATPAVIFNGDNHQGKSSVMNAIEWCLYGDQCAGEKSGIRERVGGWEVINRNATAATVELVIETDEGVTSIKRVEAKGRGKKGKRTEVTLPDGAIKEGDEAEQEIARLIGLSFKDFATTVYQHQETIRDIVIQKPKDRNDAIDRLLGLSDYRNILDGIKKSRIADAQKEMLAQYEEFRARVEQTLKIRHEDLERKKKEVTDKGLDESNLNEEKLLGLAADILERIKKFSSELGVIATPPALLSKWQDTQSFTGRTRAELDRLWAESPGIKEQSTINAKRTEADSIKTSYESRKRAFAGAKDRLLDFEREYGTQNKIDDEILESQKGINAVDQEIKQVSPKAQLVKEGIRLLKATTSDESADLCPLCEKSVPNLLEHLERKWMEEIEGRVQDLEAKKNELNRTKSELEKRKAEHGRLTDSFKTAETPLADSLKEAGKFLDRELTDQDDPAALLGREIEKMEARLKEIESAIKDKRETLSNISDSLNSLKLLYEVLELEEKISGTEKIAETAEYKELDKIRDKLAAMVVDIEKLEGLVRECMAEEATGKMKVAGDAIDRYFQKITDNPAIQKLKVKIEEDKRSGGNSYTFCDQDEYELNPILSQGDLNGLALSMFLGLVSAYSHPVGFILMDDPSQSLGTNQKKRLVDILDEVCQSGRRIVIGTMDDELQKFIEASLTRAKTVYAISNWMPESGPKIVKKV